MRPEASFKHASLNRIIWLEIVGLLLNREADVYDRSALTYVRGKDVEQFFADKRGIPVEEAFPSRSRAKLRDETQRLNFKKGRA